MLTAPPGMLGASPVGTVSPQVYGAVGMPPGAHLPQLNSTYKYQGYGM